MQVGTCDTCQRTGRKVSKAAPQLHPVPVVSPWYHIGIDFIGPISPPSQQGNVYILTIIDYFTKFVEAVPLPNKLASGVAAVLFKVSVYSKTCLISMGLQGRIQKLEEGGSFSLAMPMFNHCHTPWHAC